MALEVNDLTFSYAGRGLVLSGLNLSFGTSERVALQAPSGRGKTTLCKLLAGYLQPNSGTIMLDEQPLAQKGSRPVQLVWQHPEQAVDPRMRMQATLDEAGEVSALLLKKLGIRKSWLGRYPHELSGGELQRFCLARALASCPRYLVADEISTMLDAVTQAQIWQVLLEEAQSRNMGLIFVSHSAALTKRLATRLVAL